MEYAYLRGSTKNRALRLRCADAGRAALVRTQPRGAAGDGVAKTRRVELRRGGPFLCPPGDQQAPNDRIMRALRAQLVLETARCPDRSTPSVARRADNVSAFTRVLRAMQGPPYEPGGHALIARPHPSSAGRT